MLIRHKDSDTMHKENESSILFKHILNASTFPQKFVVAVKCDHDISEIF